MVEKTGRQDPAWPKEGKKRVKEKGWGFYQWPYCELGPTTFYFNSPTQE